MNFWNLISKLDVTNKGISNLLIASIVIYPALFIFQGGDLTDVGYIATIYQSFFDNLDIDRIFFAESFLSHFIGASWFKLFPGFGIIGLKFLYLFYLYLVNGLIYVTLKKVTNNHLLLLLGMFCSLVFVTRFNFLVWAYDSISWFFLLCSNIFVVKALNSRKNFWFFISGILLVLAGLSRLPDLIYIVLLPAALLYINLYKNKANLSAYLWLSTKQYFSFLLGVISTFLLAFLLFDRFNISNTLIDSLNLLDKSLDDSNTSSYSIRYLVKIYIDELVVFFPHLLSVLSLMITTSVFYDYYQAKKSNFTLIVFCVVITIGAISAYGGFSYECEIKYLVPAYCAFPLVFSLVKKDKLSTLVVLFIISMLSQVAGTNTGLFLKLSHGFMVLLPISFIILFTKEQIVFDNIKLYTKPILVIGVSFILFLSVLSRVGYVYHVDSGIACRLRCIHPIQHEKMYGILTTKERSFHIKQLSDAIYRNINKERNLFIYGHQPMFYYLTETTPPVNKFWLANNMVEMEEVVNSLQESIKSTGHFPVIVDTKEKILGNEGQKRFEQFLKTNKYHCVESEENFDVWVKVI